MEIEGWKELLKNPLFVSHLSRVNFFIASHHGRESGYCNDIFEHCKPELVIISDESIQYETQNTDYTTHATGVRWTDGSKRYVLTTRHDGMITISQKPNEGLWVYTAN